MKATKVNKNLHENLLSKITKKRKKQGWKIKEKYPYRTGLNRLYLIKEKL